MTSAQPDGRFGSLEISNDNLVTSFFEKPKGDGSWINAGYFVCQPEVLDYIESDHTVFEQSPLINMAKENEICTFKHKSFWMPMDTLRDKKILNELISKGKALWIKW